MSKVALPFFYYKASSPPNTTGIYRIGIHNSIIGPNVVAAGPVDRADSAPYVGTLPQGRVPGW